MTNIVVLETELGIGAVFVNGDFILCWDDRNPDSLSEAYAAEIIAGLTSALDVRARIVSADGHIEPEEYETASGPDWEGIYANLEGFDEVQK